MKDTIFWSITTYLKEDNSSSFKNAISDNISNMSSKSDNSIALVVPCFNEEESLGPTDKCLKKIARQVLAKYKIKINIYYVDDGSTDKTWITIESLAGSHGIKLSRNFGHQNAILAGLETVIDKYSATITIDADLQDDPTAILCMVKKFVSGCDIVYGVRSTRKSDTWFKRNSAKLFYYTR